MKQPELPRVSQLIGRGGFAALWGGLALLLTVASLTGCSSAEPPFGTAPAGDRGMYGYGPGMMMGGPGMMGGRGMMMGGPGMMGQSNMQRRRQARMGGVPAPYGGVTDPLPKTAATIAAGKRLYAANCAACHGPSGTGNGPAAAGLSPPPSNLRTLMHGPSGRDDYLMWALSEGEATLGTAMPAFKDALSENQRWKIIRYLQSLR